MIKTRVIKRNKWLHAKIKKNWGSLTEAEIDYYHENPDLFFAAVKKKYGMFRDNAESSIKQLKSEYSFFRWRD